MIGALTRELNEERGKNEKVNKKLKDKRSNEKELMGELTKCKLDLADTREELSISNCEVEKRDVEIDLLKSRIVKQEGQCMEGQCMYGVELVNRAAKAKNEYSRLKTELEENEEKVVTLKAKLDQLDEEFSNTRRQDQKDRLRSEMLVVGAELTDTQIEGDVARHTFTKFREQQVDLAGCLGCGHLDGEVQRIRESRNEILGELQKTKLQLMDAMP